MVVKYMSIPVVLKVFWKYKVSQFINLIILGLKNQLNDSKLGPADSTGVTGTTNLKSNLKININYNLQIGSTGGDP